MTLKFISSSKFQRIISSALPGVSTWIYYHRRLKLKMRTPSFQSSFSPSFPPSHFSCSLLHLSTRDVQSRDAGTCRPILTGAGVGGPGSIPNTTRAAHPVHWRVLSAIPPKLSAGLRVPLHCCPAGLGTKTYLLEFASLLSLLASCGLFVTQQSERSFEEYPRSREPLSSLALLRTKPEHQRGPNPCSSPRAPSITEC